MDGSLLQKSLFIIIIQWLQYLYFVLELEWMKNNPTFLLMKQYHNIESIWYLYINIFLECNFIAESSEVPTIVPAVIQFQGGKDRKQSF